MKNLLLGSLEKAVNAYLQQDGQSAKRLANMKGKSISIELLPLHLHFNCHFNDERVILTMHEELSPHTKIKGTPLQLFGAMIDKKRRHQFFADDLSIEGDAEFAQDVIHLFDQVNIDWEEHASRYIGDVPAYHLNKMMGSVRSWLGTTSADLTADLSDYLHEETACFPVREELQDFFSAVDTIRMDADRLASRLSHVQAQMENEEVQ
jgi:ubiquinone biosynthesis protein UbiJ